MSQYTNLFLRAFKRTSGSNASLPSEIRDLKKALAEYYNAGYAPGDPKRMVLQDNLDDWDVLDNFLEVIHKQGFIDQHFIKEIAEIFEGIRADRTVDQIKLDEEYDLGGYATGVNLAEDIPNEVFRNNLIEAFGKGEVEAAVRIKKDSGIKDRDPSKWGVKTSENWEDELVWLLEGRNHPEHPLRYEREDGASSKYMGIKGNTPLGGGSKGEVANLGVQNEGEAMTRVQQMIDEISNNEFLLRPFRDALASGEKFGIFNDIQRQKAVAYADEALAKLGTADTSVEGSLDNISKDISTLIENRKKRTQILKDAVDEIDPSQATDDILTDNWVDKRISEIDKETKIAQATSQEIEEAHQAMAMAIEQGRIEEAKTIADELRRMGVKLDEGGYKSDVPTDMSNILKKPEHAKGGRVGLDSGGNPLDKMKMNRRGFLGLLGSGLAALTAGGKGLFTAAPKVAEVAATNAIPLVEGMPSWFPLLVNKIRDKGQIIKQSDYIEAKEEGINIVEYRLTDDSLKASDLYMEENLNTGEITISGRGDDYQQVELTYTPGDRIVNVESGKTSEAAPSFNAEAQTQSAGQAEERGGFLGNQDTTPDLMGKYPVTVSEKGTFEASEFQKGHEGWADVENFGGVDDLQGDLSSWEKIAEKSSKTAKDIEADIKKFMETQKKPVEPDMAKGGRVGFANGGFGYGGAGSEGDLSVSQISGFDPNTAEGAYSLMKGLPGLMDLYKRQYQGTNDRVLRTIDPTWGTVAGKEATHSIEQRRALEEKWRQKMDEDISRAEEYYGFNPSDDQRKMLIDNFGDMGKHKYWLHSSIDQSPSQEQLFYANQAHEQAKDTLNQWLPEQTDLFDSIYGYNKGGRVGLQQGGNPDKINKERADWIEKLIRMKQAKKFNAEQELPSGFWEQLRRLDPWDDTPDRKRAINETDMRYRDEIHKLRYDAAKEEADYRLRLMEQEQNAPIEVAQGGRIGFQEGGASGIGSILNQINQLNNTVAQNAFGAGANMGAQSAAGQINSSQPTLSAAVGEISNQIGQLGQGIQQMIRPNQVGQYQLTAPQFNANQTQALAPPAGQVTNLDSLSPLTNQQFQAQFTPNIEGDMLSMPTRSTGDMFRHIQNPTPESTQLHNEAQAFWAQQADISGQRQDAWQGHVDDWMEGLGGDFFGIDTGQYGNYVRDYRESEQFDQSAGGQGFVDWASQQHQQNQFTPNMGWERTPEVVDQIMEDRSNFTDFYNTINPTTGGMRTGDLFQQNRGGAGPSGQYDNRSRQYDQGFSGTFGDAMGTQDPMIPQQNIYNPTGAMNAQQNIYNPYGSSGVGRSPYLGGYRDGGLTRTVPPQRGPLANGIGTRFKEKQVWL